MPETIELIDTAEVRDGQAIVNYSRTEAALATLREKYTGVQYDLTTTAGDKAARAGRLELVTLRANLEKKRKELKAPALEFGKKIDSEAARLTTDILALEEPIDKQIKADEKRRDDERRAKEAAEAARCKVHTDAIAKIAGYVEQAADLSAERIGKGIAYLQGLDLSGFEEFVSEATGTRDRTIAALEVLRAKAVAREEEAARLEAQRIEQERVAAELAEQKRQLEARQAALDAQRQDQDRIAREQAEAKRLVDEQAERDEKSRTEITPERGLQQVLKAEAATPDATDRSTPAIASPSVGSMGAGQPADAGPAGNVVPLTRPAAPPADTGARINLSDIKDRLHPIQITAEGLASLGFPHVATEKASKLYRANDFGLICAAMVAHIEAVQAKQAA